MKESGRKGKKVARREEREGIKKGNLLWIIKIGANAIKSNPIVMT